MRLKINQKRIIEGLYVVLLAFAMIYKIGAWGIRPYYINNFYLKGMIIVSCLFTALAIIEFIKRGFDKSDNEYVVHGRFYFAVFFGMQLLFECYALLLAFIGKTQLTWLSTNAVSLLSAISFMSSVYLFRERAMQLYIYAMVSNMYITIAVNCFTLGLGEIWRAIKSFLGIGTTAGVYEVHDNSFAMGLLLLYCTLSKNVKHRKFLIFSLALGVVLGQKRIELAALVIVYVLFFWDRIRKELRFKKSAEYRFLVIVMMFAMIVCYGYVNISLNGSLEEMFQRWGINSMNRNSFYSAMAQYAVFDIRYMGIGRNAAGYVIGHYFGYGVSNIHNDILKMYVENGFVLFTVWLLLFLIYLPARSIRKYSYDAGIKTITIIIYVFICYCTDNIEAYFSVQLALMLTLLFVNKECTATNMSQLDN